MTSKDLSRVIGTLVFSVTVTVALLASARLEPPRLGAPGVWPWLLTGLQVLSLWAAGRRRWWGWGLGASLQPPWIAYAILTGQAGFIPGCAVSAVVQAVSFLRHRADAREIEGNYKHQRLAGSRAHRNRPQSQSTHGTWSHHIRRDLPGPAQRRAAHSWRPVATSPG